MDLINMDNGVIEFGVLEGSVVSMEPIGGTNRFEAIEALTGRVVIIKPEGRMLFTAYEAADLELAEESEAEATEIPGLRGRSMGDIVHALDVTAYAQAVKTARVAVQAVPARLLRDVTERLREDIRQRDRQAMTQRETGTVDGEALRRWQTQTTVYRVQLEDLERCAAA